MEKAKEEEIIKEALRRYEKDDDVHFTSKAVKWLLRKAITQARKGYILKEEHEEKHDKWLEERGRMAKLLFKKGIKNW